MQYKNMIDEMRALVKAAHLQRKPIRLSQEKCYQFIDELYAEARDGWLEDLPVIIGRTQELPPGIEFVVDGVPVIIDRVTLS